MGHRVNEVFERLDTSPGQEKEIKGALREFFDVAIPARRDLRGLASDAGTIFGPEGLDETALAERFDEGEKMLATMREAATQTLRRVHEALDAEQRAELASMFGRRSSRRSSFGPYR